MNESEHSHSAHGHSHDSASQGQPNSRPRERRGWPFWVALVLALVAMMFYILSGDLGGWRNHQPPPPAVVAGK